MKPKTFDFLDTKKFLDLSLCEAQSYFEPDKLCSIINLQCLKEKRYFILHSIVLFCTFQQALDLFLLKNDLSSIRSLIDLDSSEIALFIIYLKKK